VVVDANLLPDFMTKSDNFNYRYAIIKFPQFDSNIPTALTYIVFISQLIRYARDYSLYSYFIQRHSILNT